MTQVFAQRACSGLAPRAGDMPPAGRYTQSKRKPSPYSCALIKPHQRRAGCCYCTLRTPSPDPGVQPGLCSSPVFHLGWAGWFLLRKREELQPEAPSPPRVNTPHCKHKANDRFFRLGVTTLIKKPSPKI